MKRRVAALLAIPALLLAAVSFAQPEEDFDPPPPPPEEYDSPPTASDPGDRPRTRERGRGKNRSRNRDRDVAVGLGGILLGEILEEIEEQPRSRSWECTYERAGGWMQPTQGVWLDDSHFDMVNFGGANSPNPQLVQINPWGVYEAVLPMIAGRPTALAGAIEYRDERGNKHRTGGDRSAIVIKGLGNCSIRRPVKVRFTVHDAGGARVVYETPTLPELVPLEGLRKKEKEEFSVSVPAPEGLPPIDPGAFTIQGENGSSYRIVASVVRADTNTPTNLEVEVHGTVRTTAKMVVQFVPLILSRGQPRFGETGALRAFARELDAEVWLRIPDVFPLKPREIETYVGDTALVGRLDPGQKRPNDPDYLNPQRVPLDGKPPNPTPRQARLQRLLGDYLSTAGVIGGADRVVAVARLSEDTGDEFEWIISAAGVAENDKVVFVPAPQATRSLVFRPASEVVDIVAHELTHTLPNFPFSEARMVRQCGRDYHDTGPPLGRGLQLTEKGKPMRRLHENSQHMMGGHSRGAWWISQCTYAHLIGALAQRPDPELWLVRTIVSRTGGRMRAELMPGYDLMGISDVEPGGAGAWTVRLRNAAGVQIAAWPFDPTWEGEHGPRDGASLSLRIPAMPEARTMEIVHQGQVLATRPIAAAPPSLTVAAPKIAKDQRSVNLGWTARSAAGKPVLASVYVSTNGGRYYSNRLFEQPVTNAIVALDPAEPGEQVIKIVVTDGARSSERLVRIPKAS